MTNYIGNCLYFTGRSLRIFVRDFIIAYKSIKNLITKIDMKGNTNKSNKRPCTHYSIKV